MRFSCCILLLSFSSIGAAKSLVLLNWPNYISDKVLQDFETQTGIKVTVIHYESDETKDSLLNATNGKGYDLLVSSQFRLANYASRDWLEPLEQSKLSNFIHVDDKWKTEAVNSQYCSPYFWGTIGILYRKDLTTPPTSWKSFFSEDKPELINKIQLLSDSRDVLSMALLAHNSPPNTKPEVSINNAANLIYDRLKYINGFSSLNLEPNSNILTGEIYMAMSYNGDALYLQQYSDNLDFVIPSEGTTLWLDCISILKQSKMKQEAYQFLDYLQRPEVATHLALTYKFATTNKTALSLLPQTEINNKTIYPNKELIKRSSLNKPLSAKSERLYHTIYNQLLYAHKGLKQ